MSIHRSTIPETDPQIPDAEVSTLRPDHLPAPGRAAWRRKLMLTVLAVTAFLAAVLVLGPIGLIPFGLLLAFSADTDEEQIGRTVILTPRNVALAAAMMVAVTLFWVGYTDLSASTLVVIAGALIALPLALQESAGHAARDRTIVVTKRSLILALWGLVIFSYLYQERGCGFSDWPPCLSCCRCRWRRRGRGAPDGGGSNSGCSATRSAGRCARSWCNSSISGCSAGCSVAC